MAGECRLYRIAPENKWAGGKRGTVAAAGRLKRREIWAVSDGLEWFLEAAPLPALKKQPCKELLFSDGRSDRFGFGDDDRFGRYVVVVAVAFGGDAFDGIDYIKTIDDFAEYGVAPVLDDGFAV